MPGSTLSLVPCPMSFSQPPPPHYPRHLNMTNASHATPPRAHAKKTRTRPYSRDLDSRAPPSALLPGKLPSSPSPSVGPSPSLLVPGRNQAVKVKLGDEEDLEGLPSASPDKVPDRPLPTDPPDTKPFAKHEAEETSEADASPPVPEPPSNKAPKGWRVPRDARCFWRCWITEVDAGSYFNVSLFRSPSHPVASLDYLLTDALTSHAPSSVDQMEFSTLLDAEERKLITRRAERETRLLGTPPKATNVSTKWDLREVFVSPYPQPCVEDMHAER